MRDRIEKMKELDIVADFANDGRMGGDAAIVKNVLIAEMALGREYGSKMNLSKMKVYPFAREAKNYGNRDWFKQNQTGIELSGNIEFMKVPIAGSQELVKQWAEGQVGISKKLMTEFGN